MSSPHKSSTGLTPAKFRTISMTYGGNAASAVITPRTHVKPVPPRACFRPYRYTRAGDRNPLLDLTGKGHHYGRRSERSKSRERARKKSMSFTEQKRYETRRAACIKQRLKARPAFDLYQREYFSKEYRLAPEEIELKRHQMTYSKNNILMMADHNNDRCEGGVDGANPPTPPLRQENEVKNSLPCDADEIPFGSATEVAYGEIRKLAPIDRGEIYQLPKPPITESPQPSDVEGGHPCGPGLNTASPSLKMARPLCAEEETLTRGWANPDPPVDADEKWMSGGRRSHRDSDPRGRSRTVTAATFEAEGQGKKEEADFGGRFRELEKVMARWVAGGGVTEEKGEKEQSFFHFPIENNDSNSDNIRRIDANFFSHLPIEDDGNSNDIRIDAEKSKKSKILTRRAGGEEQNEINDDPGLLGSHPEDFLEISGRLYEVDDERTTKSFDPIKFCENSSYMKSSFESDAGGFEKHAPFAASSCFEKGAPSSTLSSDIRNKQQDHSDGGAGLYYQPEDFSAYLLSYCSLGTKNEKDDDDSRPPQSPPSSSPCMEGTIFSCHKTTPITSLRTYYLGARNKNVDGMDSIDSSPCPLGSSQGGSAKITAQ